MAELRARIAELTAENAPYAGRASCTRRTASCTSCHVSCNAHLSHGAVRISICRAAHGQRSCQLALLGLAERAQHARATQPFDGRHHATCQYLVRNTGVRLRSAHCRRSTRTSWRRIRSSLLSAAQVMRRCKMVAARSAHSYAHVHPHAPSSQACVSALRECAGRASVSAMWAQTPSAPCRAPCGGSLTRVGSRTGWDISGGTLGAHLQAGSDAVHTRRTNTTQQSSRCHTSRLTASSHDCSIWLLPASSSKHAQYPV
jgi:hypothetical protein